MTDSINLCLHCGERIKSGRSDKKFCDAGCKDEYYNSRKIREHQEIRKIDLALRRNRRILRKFFDPKKESVIRRSQLLKEGFEFDYHTHHVVTKHKANEFIFCYDYGYLVTEADKVRIIKSFD